MTTVFVLLVMIGQQLGAPGVWPSDAECQAAGQSLLHATHGQINGQKVGFRCTESRIIEQKQAEQTPGADTN